MIPHATRDIERLRAHASAVREVHPRRPVRVEINPADVRHGVLLAWIKPQGEGWLGEVVVIDDAGSLRPV